MANQKNIPFIPKQTPDFKPFMYYWCESSTTVKKVTRNRFLALLGQQPHPEAQINIDFEGGIAYLFPYSEAEADTLRVLYREFQRDYKRIWREHHAIRNGTRQTVVSLEPMVDSDGDVLTDSLIGQDTPESHFLSLEKEMIHHRAFDELTESDQEILLGYLHAECNARELARRLGKDPSGVTKLIKRAAIRLQKIIEKNF